MLNATRQIRPQSMPKITSVADLVIGYDGAETRPVSGTPESGSPTVCTTLSVVELYIEGVLLWNHNWSFLTLISPFTPRELVLHLGHFWHSWESIVSEMTVSMISTPPHSAPICLCIRKPMWRFLLPLGQFSRKTAKKSAWKSAMAI